MSEEESQRDIGDYIPLFITIFVVAAILGLGGITRIFVEFQYWKTVFPASLISGAIIWFWASRD